MRIENKTAGAPNLPFIYPTARTMGVLLGKFLYEIVQRHLGIIQEWPAKSSWNLIKYAYVCTPHPLPRMGNTSASVIKGTGFKSRSDNRLYRQDFVVSIVYAGMLPRIRTRQIPSTYFPIHYSLKTLLPIRAIRYDNTTNTWTKWEGSPVQNASLSHERRCGQRPVMHNTIRSMSCSPLTSYVCVCVGLHTDAYWPASDNACYLGNTQV
jgi:hypothetical protein